MPDAHPSGWAYGITLREEIGIMRTLSDHEGLTALRSRLTDGGTAPVRNGVQTYADDIEQDYLMEMLLNPEGRLSEVHHQGRRR